MNPYTDRAWFGQVRRMRRSNRTYKPAMLLAVLDLIEEGHAAPEHVPLQLAVERFDAIIGASGAAEGIGRAFMPVYHLSSSSNTSEPFWRLLNAGRPVGSRSAFNDNGALSRAVDAIEFDEVLADELRTVEGLDLARSTIYQLLEDDGHPECLALLASHDRDKPAVEERVDALNARVHSPFVLDDPSARLIRSVREHFVRDRALRRAVLPAYEYSCALCSTRIIWNNLVEVEAAHIKPRSLRGADDPRNALALCQTHHWAFDLGLWSARDDYRVIVSRPIEPRGDDLASLRTFENKELHVPVVTTAQPHTEALRWHREHRFDRAA